MFFGGGSAGGLSTFLHVDRIAAKVKARNPSVRVHAVADVGYFLDHGNAFDNPVESPNTPGWGQSNFSVWMRNIYGMQNISFGDELGKGGGGTNQRGGATAAPDSRAGSSVGC